MKKQFAFTAFLFFVSVAIIAVCSYFIANTAGSTQGEAAVEYSAMLLSLIKDSNAILALVLGIATLIFWNAIEDGHLSADFANKLSMAIKIAMGVLFTLAILYYIFISRTILYDAGIDIDSDAMWKIRRITDFIPLCNFIGIFRILLNPVSMVHYFNRYTAFNLITIAGECIIIFGMVRLFLLLEKYSARVQESSREISFEEKLSIKPSSTFLGAIKSGYSNFLSSFRSYVAFEGCTSRSEFWYFLLFEFILSMAFLSVLEYLFLFHYSISILTPILVASVIFGFVIFFPTVSIMTRRAHDLGHMGIFLWIPIFGFILSLMPGREDSIYRTESDLNPVLSRLAGFLLRLIFVYGGVEIVLAIL